MIYADRVTPLFCAKVDKIAHVRDIEADWLMACIAFETGETFSPSVLNKAGSGAVGLIQFMPQTAAALGTSTADLMRMTAEEQLDYVDKYIKQWAHRIGSLEDLYLSILWPAGIGKKLDDVLMLRNDPLKPKNYVQNKGLDYDRDGKITVREATRRVRELYNAAKKLPEPTIKGITVKFGDAGLSVKILQQTLISLGYPLLDDGIFGNMTGDAFFAAFGVRAKGDNR